MGIFNLFLLTEHLFGQNLYSKSIGRIESRWRQRIASQFSSDQVGNYLTVREFGPGMFPAELSHPSEVRVYRGAAGAWPCVQEWSLDYFKANFGDVQVTLFNNPGLKSKASDQDFESVPLSDYIDLLRSGSKKYLKFSRMVDQQSILREDFDDAWLTRFKKSVNLQQRYYMFMGASGTDTPIHSAVQNTVFVQCWGRKKWTFYPVADRMFLNVRASRTNYFYSNTDPRALSDDEDCLYHFASPYEIVLEPGDVLFFPPWTWHMVENPTDSIGVAFKFIDIASAIRSSPMLSFLFTVSTRPFLLQSYLSSFFEEEDLIFRKKIE